MTPEMLDSIIADLCNSHVLKFSQRYAIRRLREERNDLQSQLAAANERADAAVKALERVPVSGHPGLRALVHAAFHIIDDSETGPDGRISIDNDIAANDLQRLPDALDVLGIESHEGLDAVFLAAHVPAQPVAQAQGVPVDDCVVNDKWLQIAVRDAGIVRAAGAPPETIIHAAIYAYLLAASTIEERDPYASHSHDEAITAESTRPDGHKGFWFEAGEIDGAAKPEDAT